MIRPEASFCRARKMLFIAMTGLVVAFSAAAEAGVAPKPAFAPGQMWSIKASPPTSAKIVVNRIETWKGKIAVHVGIIDIPIPPSAPDAGRLVSVDHVPFDQSTLASSVDKLLETDVSPSPGFYRSYETWRSDRNAGIFEVSVSQAIQLLLETIIRGRA